MSFGITTTLEPPPYSYNPKFYPLISTCTWAIGLTINVFTIYMIYFVTPVKMKIIRKYLLAHQLLGTFSDFIICALMRPVMFLPLFAGITAGPLTTYLGISCYDQMIAAFGCVKVVIALTIAPFVYRYRTVTGNGSSSSMKWFDICLVLYGLIASSTVMILMHIARVPQEIGRMNFRNHHPSTVYYLLDLPGIYVDVFSSNIYFSILLYYLLFLLVFEYGTLSFCVFMTFYSQQSKFITSENTRKMNRNFNRLLLIQTVVPTCALGVPAAYIVSCILFTNVVDYTQDVTNFFAYILSMHSTLSSIITLITSSPYRRYIMEIIVKNIKKQNRSRVSIVPHSTS